MKKRIGAIVCSCLMMVSCVALATNGEKIIKYFSGLGDGVDSAADSGYVEFPEMDYTNSLATIESNEKLVENMNVDVKIDSFIMDNNDLNTQFVLKFEDKINESINFEDIDTVELKDLIVLDEENRILYSGNDKSRFEEFCKENKLDYIFGKHNEKYLNCGLNHFINYKSIENQSINLTYNIYSDMFPRSKKLTFDFTQIIMSNANNENKINIKGKWNVTVNVPENMYNRSEEYYKVVSCDNEDFKVYSASISDTGFKIGLKITNLQRPNKLTVEELEKLRYIDKNLKDGNMTQEEANTLKARYEEFMIKRRPVTIEDTYYDKVSYIENSNGEKFKCTLSPSRETQSGWIDKNNYNFYETFSMTKYSATDKIKVVLFNYNEPVTIELEKNNYKEI